IYIAQFREELIILDTKKDKYMICPEQISELFADILEKNNSHLDNERIIYSGSQYSSQDSAYLQKLLNDYIIERKDSPYPFYIDKKPQSEGVSNVDWRLPLENKKVSLNLQVLKAFTTLIKVNFYIKFKGLYHTIQLIKRSRKSHSKYIIPQAQELRDLANTVNKACLVYPNRIKCLEWAMTFVLLALKRKWKCNLEIGVQNYPFMAHAWVECDGKVVMDSQDLREGLGIILNEPFRKVKI
ncbi:MAG TPA: lasso peptide biosynthesis B2 protein, partial [Alphaproteobacteria bacterium]|nr:lasso peptide biosynthesis B2 protein [Alphaproteobacteria bacterium]